MRSPRARLAVLALAAAMLPFASPLLSAPPTPSVSAAVPTPAGWRREASPEPPGGGGTYSVALPPGLATIPVKGIESQVSEYRSKSLRLIFDFGGSESPAAEECPRHSSSCATSMTKVDGVPAVRASHYEADPDGGLPYRISYTILFGLPSPPAAGRRRISLRIWAECVTPRACALADRIVKTIDILPDR